MVIFYKKWKKYNEFQLTKNKMDLNIRKMTNHPPSPASQVTPITSVSRVVSGARFRTGGLFECGIAHR